jgi:hypothetical protein
MISPTGGTRSSKGSTSPSKKGRLPVEGLAAVLLEAKKPNHLRRCIGRAGHSGVLTDSLLLNRDMP